MAKYCSQRFPVKDALLEALADTDRVQLVMRLVLFNPNLSPAMHSISCRVILSILLTLPQMAPASLSPDLKLYPVLLERVQELSAELGAGSTSGMSKSLSLVIGGSLGNPHVGSSVPPTVLNLTPFSDKPGP